MSGGSFHRAAERGGGKLKALLALLVLIGGVYVMLKVAPAYLNNYELKDKMDVEARFAAVQRRPAEQVQDNIYREIQKLEIPASRDDIHVDANDRGVRIRVNYTVVVDLPGYQLQLNFNPEADNRTL